MTKTTYDMKVRKVVRTQTEKDEKIRIYAVEAKEGKFPRFVREFTDENAWRDSGLVRGAVFQVTVQITQKTLDEGEES